jgi:hypothetical protein
MESLGKSDAGLGEYYASCLPNGHEKARQSEVVRGGEHTGFVWTDGLVTIVTLSLVPCNNFFVTVCAVVHTLSKSR